MWQRRRPEPGGGEGGGLGGGALGGGVSVGGRLSVYRVTPSQQQQQQQQQQQHESVAAQLRRRVSRVESLRKLLLGASHLDTRSGEEELELITNKV